MRKLIDWITRAWSWLVKKLKGRPPDKGPPLRKITNINTEMDMSGNVTLTWNNPTERTDGVPVDGSDFEVRIGLRAVGASGFTPLVVVSGTQEPIATLQDQAGGDYEFELTLHDLVLDQDHVPLIVGFTVPVGELNPITGVEVTLS